MPSDIATLMEARFQVRTALDAVSDAVEMFRDEHCAALVLQAQSCIRALDRLWNEANAEVARAREQHKTTVAKAQQAEAAEEGR